MKHHKEKRINGTIEEIVDSPRAVRLIKEMHLVRTDDHVKLVISRKLPANGRPKSSPMVFVHGFGQNRYTWNLGKRSLENYFVENGYETYNAELRGHGLSRLFGGSSYPESYEDYLKYDLTAIIRYALKTSGAKKLFICGHSLGAMLAYGLGCRDQKAIAGVVSFAGPAGFGKGNPAITWGSKIGKWLHDHTPLSRIDIPYFPVDLIGQAVKRLLFYFDNPHSYNPLSVWYPGSMERDVLIERITKGFDRTSFEVLKFLVHCAATGRFETRDGRTNFEVCLERFEAPILFIAGNADRGAPVESVRSGYEKAGSRDKTLKVFGNAKPKDKWGHIDLICGKKAPIEVWPYVLSWVDARGQAEVSDDSRNSGANRY